MNTDERLAQIRELAEKAAAILHRCDRKQVNCTTSEYCNRDRAYIADMIEQEVGTPVLTLLDVQKKRIEELERQIEAAIQDVCRCFWCGELFDYPKRGTNEEQASALTKHTMSCATHPMHLVVEAEARASRAEQANTSLLESCATYEKAMANYESALATERERVIQECASAMCEYCALPPIDQQGRESIEPVPYYREAGYICNFGEFNGGFVHKSTSIECVPCHANPIRALSSLPTPPLQAQWIRVEDKLPDEGEQALIVICGEVQWITARYDGANWRWADDESRLGKHSLDGLTHWQPLPTPPEEREGKAK